MRTSSVRGPLGMRPYVVFNPNRPQYDDGIRIEPPPSPPVPMGTRPPATAAAVPPDDPPGVRSRSHGLRVVPLSLVDVWPTNPNSLAVVSPTSTAPAPRNRDTCVWSMSDVRSLNTSDASVNGHPFTRSSSFTPMGTPPNGNDTSAAPAAARAPCTSR